MFRPLARSTRRPHRRGTSFVLIVVVMISFAAAVGVAFALFAGQALRMAQTHKEAQGGGGVPLARAPEPTGTLNRFLGALVFGVGGDSDEDVTNALRGHELSRSMYGGNLELLPGGSNPVGITTPWNGVGLPATATGYINYTQIPGLLYDPEYSGTRTFTGTTRALLRNDVTSGTAPRAYTSKAAGYSYPDLKDFFAAAVDSATGQVMTPSFHRPWLWDRTVTNSTTTTTTTLGPDNPNWTDPSNAARMKTLRPRPLEHPKFPRVPMNADGTYTGDVQNWPGGYTYDPVSKKYFARNDSLWMHIGLPPVPFGNRKVQPLVAPLIVPLDGLLNAGAHGNSYRPPAAGGGPGTHLSYAGYDPSEVNIGRATATDPSSLPNNRAAVVNMHANAQQRFSLSTHTNDKAPYDPYRLIPQPAAMPPTPTTRRLHDYAPVAWGNAAVGQPAYPSGTSLTGIPNFGAGFSSQNLHADNHPTLHSAGQWSQYSSRQSPLSDIKRLHLRYAFTPDWYAAAELGRAANQDLGEGTETFSYVTQRDTFNRHRLDNAHNLRKLITPYAFGLDRPKLAPNFQAGGTLTMNGIRPGAINPGGTFPSSGGNTFSDIPAGNALVNQWAALGTVDVNRPLHDYRENQTLPLGIGNVTFGSVNYTRANSDRRKLAQDIFVRLAAATGAALQPKATGVEYPEYPYTVQPLAGGVGPGSGQFNALRYLAQLAVNIVDFRDEDDISTAFVWNPLPRGMMDPADPHQDPRNFDPANVGNCVVFGVEKSRAVLNEVYSEITNDRNTEANGADTNGDNQPDQVVPNTGVAWVKFWAELVNPMTPSNSNIIPNAAPLRGYRIEIARGTTKAGNSGAVTNLFDPSNTTGGFSAPPDAAFDLHSAANAPAAPTTITANNGTYTAPALPGAGFVLVGPTARVPAKPAPAEEFNPAPAGRWADGNVVRSPDPGPAGATSAAMGYTVPLTTMDAMMNVIPIEPGSREFRRHVVLLRRKANPYIVDDPANAAVAQLNPHVTVDVMDCVPSFDALHRFAGEARSRVPRDGTNMTGYDPRPERFSVGKVQPYAGYAELPTTTPPMPEPAQHPRSAQPGSPNYNTYTFPESMVLAQKPVPALAGEPQHTFGQHNGQDVGGPTEPTPGAGLGTVTESGAGTPAAPKARLSDTLMTPFDWLVHPDRTVVNNVELFQVRDSAPHLVTQRFVRHLATNAAPGLTYEGGYARWQFTNDGLGRALELLSVKPFTTSVAHGGRIAGQLNVNAIRDKRVLNALFDPQSGNKFNDTFVDTAWNNWLASRTPGTTVTLPNSTQTLRVSGPSGRSVQDGGAVGTADAPFQAGAAMVGSGFAYTAGASETLTVLRSGGGTRPYLFNPQLNTTPNAQLNAQARGQEYFEAEPLRKITNSITTVSHTYAVFLTIGYFEIDLETVNTVSGQRDGLLNLGGNTNMTRLAHEAYLNVPGDMRQKFVAVVDMSMMAMPALTTEPKARPYFTTLEETARPSGTGTDTLKVAATSTGVAGVDSDGNLVGIAVGDNLVLGYGAEQQPANGAATAVTVTGIAADPNGGPLSVTVTGLTRTAWAGSSVSNARAGYPGPQPSFDYTADRYKPVVPYVGRVR